MKDRKSGAGSSAVRQVVIDFLEYALAFTVIIECFSLFHFSENYRATTVEAVATAFAAALAGLLTVVFLVRFGRKYLEDFRNNRLLYLLPFAAVLAFLVLNVLRCGGENALRKYLLSFVVFLPLAFLLFRGYRFGRPWRLMFRYADLVCLIAVGNLIVFAVFTFRPELVQSFILNARWTKPGYLTPAVNVLNLLCYFPSAATRTIAGFTLVRNQGFFPEPLMYCVPLITALYTELFLREKGERRVWKWAVLVLAVFTSQATLGMMLAALALGIKLIEGAKPKRRKLMILPALVVVAAACFLLLRQKETAGGNSTASHIVHYIIALKAFLAHPLLGCGFLREDLILQYLTPDQMRLSQGLSNSIAVVLAEGGALLGLLCTAPFLIGLAQAFSKDRKTIALWALGPLGLYCLIPIHFHLLLMLLMAFGFALPGKLPVGEEAAAEEAPQRSPGAAAAAKAAAILAVCGVAAALFLSRGLWSAASRWLRYHQLYLGQSAWKLYFFAVFLILAVLTLRGLVRACREKRPGSWAGETVWFLLCSGGFAAFYPVIYSHTAAILDPAPPFGDLFETAAMAFLYFGCVAAGWLLLTVLRRSRRVFLALLACAIAAAGALTAVSIRAAASVDVRAGEIAEAVSTAAAAGKVYANERPAALKRAIPALSWSPARDGAFAALDKVSAVAARDRNLRDLINAGFRVAELSPDYVLYSNDEAAIEALQRAGYTFSEYYPFALSTDNEASVVLENGIYTLTAELRKAPEPEASHRPVGSLRITSYYGTENVKERSVYADEFDADGRCTVSLTFTAGSWEGMAYELGPADGGETVSASLSLRATPDYLTRTTYDGRYQVVRLEYRELTGEAHLLPQGFAAVTKDYDRAGRVVRQAYFGADGNPTRIRAGYAGFERSYNRQGRMRAESYFDEAGKPCLLPQGYASYDCEYDARGNAAVLRYYDEEGQPVLTAWGYAELRRAFDDRRRVTDEWYFGTEGESIALANGAASVHITYASDGTETSRRYYDLSGAEFIPEE